jgi:hypothetical protein
MVSCGAADRLNNHLVTDQQLAAPVLRGGGKQPALSVNPSGHPSPRAWSSKTTRRRRVPKEIRQQFNQFNTVA